MREAQQAVEGSEKHTAAAHGRIQNADRWQSEAVFPVRGFQLFADGPAHEVPYEGVTGIEGAGSPPPPASLEEIHSPVTVRNETRFQKSLIEHSRKLRENACPVHGQRSFPG